MSEDAQAAAPLAVHGTLEGEPAVEDAHDDAGAPTDGQAPSDHAHHHHHHQHGGQTHAH